MSNHSVRRNRVSLRNSITGGQRSQNASRRRPDGEQRWKVSAHLPGHDRRHDDRRHDDRRNDDRRNATVPSTPSSATSSIAGRRRELQDAGEKSTPLKQTPNEATSGNSSSSRPARVVQDASGGSEPRLRSREGSSTAAPPSRATSDGHANGATSSSPTPGNATPAVQEPLPYQQRKDLAQRLQRDLSLEAISAFLRDNGLGRAAAALQSELRDLPLGAQPPAAAGETYAPNLQRLGVALGRISDGCWDGEAVAQAVARLPAPAEEVWFDELLPKAVASPDIAEPVSQPPWKRRFDAELELRARGEVPSADAQVVREQDAALAAQAAAVEGNAELFAAGVLQTADLAAAAQSKTAAGSAPEVAACQVAGGDDATAQAVVAEAAAAATHTNGVEAHAKPATAAQPMASASYVSVGLPAPEGFVDDLPVEAYRDDHDPGYRIIELTEGEFLTEIQQFLAALAAAEREKAQAEDPSPRSPCQPTENSDKLPKVQTPEAQVVADVDELAEATMTAGEQGSSVGIMRRLKTAMDDIGARVRGGGPAEAEMASGGGLCPDEAADVAKRGAADEELPCFGADLGAQAPHGAEEGKTTAAVIWHGKSEDQATQSATLAAPMSSPARPETQSAPEQATTLPEASADASSTGAAPTAAVSQAVAQDAQGQQIVLPHVLPAKRKDKTKGPRPLCRHAPSGDAFYPVQLDGVTYDSFPLRIVYERDSTGFEESKEFPIRVNSIIAARYQVLAYLGSAAFSRAVQCLDLETNTMVCMKIIKNDKDFFDQSLDEIKLLKIILANCDNVDEKHVLRLYDCFYHKEHLIIVTELLRDNLYEFSKFNREFGAEPYFTLGRLQRVTKQVLMALEYIHGLWLIHGDLKPENILVKSYSRCEVKVIDFGSSCFLDDTLSSYVQSRSYRAPEVILGLPYDQKVDIWSLGCIIAELWTGYVLFQNDCVQSLLARVLGIIGSFPAHMLTNGRLVHKYFAQDGRLFREIDVMQAARATAAAANGELTPEQAQLTTGLALYHVYVPKRSSLWQRMRVNDKLFVNFLETVLALDPARRPTAVDALGHPWLTPGLYPDGL
eukprot:TRINITY_DN8843_c0_g1_i2.p1 TRINITY_DN8843_c0_g1~~TRINITY_DN8843_c0_g1_i2.p1  ORF type:complete len:1073 (+),score=251.67 TRINITY_DN8843_c0_g1_i2:149-3367(+)